MELQLRLHVSVDAHQDHLQRAYLQTDFCVLDSPVGSFTLRCGELSPELMALLEESGSDCWAFITAANPQSTILDDATNESRNAKLKQTVESAGYRAFLGEGRDPRGEWKPEVSFLIIGINESAAMELGRMFGQNAIVAGSKEQPTQLIWITKAGEGHSPAKPIDGATVPHLKDLPLGAHLVTPRVGYAHHGIYVGDGQVVHYAGLANDFKSGPIELVSLEVFAQGRGFAICKHIAPDPPETIIARAHEKLGEDAYCVFSNNCEHFCNWCVTGNHQSYQVERAVPVGSASFATAASLAARAAIVAAGPVYGLSGAGVMSGLASIGGFVGGGAVAGIALLGAAPGAAMASLMNSTVLRDQPNLQAAERAARRTGRRAGYAGAIAGTAGSIAAVSGMGAVGGLSASGITTGLATVGGLIGGGMAAGVTVAATAPVIAAAAVGYSAYRASKHLKRRKEPETVLVPEQPNADRQSGPTTPQVNNRERSAENIEPATK